MSYVVKIPTGINVYTLSLTLVLVILKLADVITISWLLVFLPLYGIFLTSIVILVCIIVYAYILAILDKTG